MRYVVAIAGCMALFAGCGDANTEPRTADGAGGATDPQNGGTGQEAEAGGGGTTSTTPGVDDRTTSLTHEEKPPQCELPPLDTDPCHACAVEHCCGQVIGRYWESGTLGGWEDYTSAFYPAEVNRLCFQPGMYGGRCLRDDWNGSGDSWLTLTQACFEDKVAMGSTAESLDIVGECMCEQWSSLQEYEGRDCRGPLDHLSPGNDSSLSNFIACVLWPLEGDGDAGASETPAVSRCAEICFPSWH